MQQPKLRFKGFSESWSKVELESIAEGITSGKSNFISKSIDSVNKIPVLGSTGIIGYRAEAEYKGDFVLIARVGANAGKVNFYSGEVGISDNTIYLQPKKGNDFKFLLNYLYSLDLNKLSFGSGQPLIKSSELKKLKVYAPSLSEQKKISSFYTLLNQRIEKQHEKLEKLEQFKKSMMQKIFSQELRFKDEDGGEFPEWKETTFGEVVTNKSEKHNPKSETIVLPCIELENIEQGSGQLIGNINNSDQQSMKNKFDKGSILFGKLRPYLKKYLYTNFDGLCSTEIWVLNSKNSRLINGFIYFFIQGAEFLEGANKSIGSKMPRADWNSVSELPFNIPSKKEQEKIVDYLGVLENKIFKEKEKLMVLEEQKKGFMQGMFL